MKDIQRIHLAKPIDLPGPIELLWIEASITATGPLVIIGYADEGQEQPYGLRYDLDKEVFLDHFDDPEKEKSLTSRAAGIASTIRSEISTFVVSSEDLSDEGSKQDEQK